MEKFFVSEEKGFIGSAIEWKKPLIRKLRT